MPRYYVVYSRMKNILEKKLAVIFMEEKLKTVLRRKKTEKTRHRLEIAERCLQVEIFIYK